MIDPTISICIPAFQADRFLAPALDSVRRQTYPRWELIVVEDGSRDRTAAIVAEFGRQVHQSVRYLRHERNQGLPATRNTGIQAASYRWVALLDSDDLWMPEHLESLVSTLNDEDAELIHAGSLLFESETGRVIAERVPSPEMVAAFPHSLFCADYIIQPASVLLRRELWQRVGGFDPAFRYVEDREMWLRCARAGARFAYSGRQTCLYRKHAGALSTKSADMAEAAAAVFEKHLDWDLIPRAIRYRLAAEAWAAAGRLRQKGDPARARRHFQRACAVERRLDWWLRGAACGLRSSLRSLWHEPAIALS